MTIETHLDNWQIELLTIVLEGAKSTSVQAVLAVFG